MHDEVSNSTGKEHKAYQVGSWIHKIIQKQSVSHNEGKFYLLEVGVQAVGIVHRFNV